MFSKRHRSQGVLKSRPVSVLLGALVLLSMWSTSIAAIFCPHMNGGSDCCLNQSSKGRHHEVMSGMSSRNHMILHGMHTSDMDMQRMDMPDMGASHVHRAVISESAMNDVNILDLPVYWKPNVDVNRQSITQPAGTCSHCMMHSQPRIAVVMGAVVQNNISHEFTAAEGAAECIMPSESSFRFFDLHDHGPPGSSTPRHLLINVFRI